MKSYKVGVIETPYKELAFILSNGGEREIKESKMFNVDLYFKGEIEGDELVFSWEVNDEDYIFTFKLVYEAVNVIVSNSSDPDGEDACDRMIESIGVGTLVYYSKGSLIKDLGEVGKAIWNNAEYKIENNLL